MPKKQVKIFKDAEQFHQLFKFKSEALIVFDLDSLSVQDANIAACELFGYKHSELVNLSIDNLAVHPQISRARIDLMKNKHEFHYSVYRHLVRQSGEVFNAEIHINNLPDYNLFVASFYDITDDIKNNEKIRKLKAAVEQNYNIIIITDTDGNIEYVNKMFEDVTGYAPDEVIYEKPSILKSGKHDRYFYKQMWETIKAGKVWQGEIMNRKKSGELYWEHATITPVKDVNGTIINFVANKEDITDEKENEKKMLEAIISTEERERKKFAEDLHDELGPFLSSIKLFINEFQYEDNDINRRKELVLYLNQLIDEAIDKTRTISNGLMPGILADYGLFKALTSFFNKLNATNSIHINMVVTDDKERFSSLIETVVYRIVIELINNSIRHSGCDKIDIVFNTSKKDLEINYKDNGKGYQSNDKGQTGMGLNNILNRVKSLAGTLQMINKPDRGLEFIIRIGLNN